MASQFEKYLKDRGEVGYVEKIVHSVAYVSGLPGAHSHEIIVFESEDIGQVLSLTNEYVEVLLLSTTSVEVGSRAARTDLQFQIPISEDLMGRIVDPLIRPMDGGSPISVEQYRVTDSSPQDIEGRAAITKPLETGVSIVDAIIPIAQGQRELILGDRATGKASFLQQVILSQARNGAVCIYALVGKRGQDIVSAASFFKSNNILDKTIVVASRSADPSGLIYLTPFVAMTIAEYYRDKGKDVVLVIDDLTNHAKYYREIMLLAKRFPGRNSYPADIFYIHSRLLERAGNFESGSITCLPVAETVLGDVSGYIQTNIMSMTDGHLFFDVDLFDQGRRPAVNPFLSVTRVGHSGQTSLQRDMNRQLSSFLVYHQRMQSFIHFGAEMTENVRTVLAMGDRVLAFFNQNPDTLVPLNISAIVLAGLWAGIWKDVEVPVVKKQMTAVTQAYLKDKNFRINIDNFIQSQNDFVSMVTALKQKTSLLTAVFGS